MGSDNLTVPSRTFYERAKAKNAFALFLTGCSMMLLGFCSTSGGLSASSQQGYAHTLSMSNSTNVAAMETQRSYQALISGYGFASFVYILGSLLCLFAAFYISPLCCG